jgi:hypothetical protein
MAIPAEGTKLQIESATPGTYTDIGGVEAVTPPSTTTGEVKKTTLQSTSQEYRAGKIPDRGTLQFRLQYDPNSTVHQDLEDALDAGTTKNWKLVYADGMTTPASETFAGFITNFEKSELADETNALADLTIRVTGTVTRTPGAA